MSNLLTLYNHPLYTTRLASNRIKQMPNTTYYLRTQNSTSKRAPATAHSPHPPPSAHSSILVLQI